jgi:hypothetical protein
LRDLFFLAPAPAFAPLDREGFIPRVLRVFTRIRLGASLVARSGGVRLTCKLRRGGRSTSGWLARSTPVAANAGNDKTLRVSAFIYNLTGGGANGRMDKYWRLTQRRLPDSSASNTRCTPSRGLDYIR